MIPFNRLALLGEFNAASSQQLLAYFKAKGYKLQFDRKTRKPTTSEEALERTLVDHPNDEVLAKAIELRHIKKGRGDLKDSSLGRDGRFHSEFPFEPDTGRLSSKHPCLENVPNPDRAEDDSIEQKIAILIRSTVEADPGKILIEVDWSAIQALLTGWFAGDEDYMALSKKDSHAFYTSFILHHQKKLEKPFSVKDPDIDEKLKWLKKNFPFERALGKQINLATGFGMKERHLAQKLRCSLREAATFLQLKDEMAPKVAKWKRDTQRQAHSQGYLVTPFGYVRKFFAVYEKRKDGTFRLGPEANEALAFLPQGTEGGMLRWCIVELGEQEEAFGFELLVPNHDAILLQTEDEPTQVRKVIAYVQGVMGREWPELNNLRVDTEVKVGKNWGAMEVWK